MIIGNQECDYIVKNYKAVLALVRSYELTQTRVPKWLLEQLHKGIEQRIHEIQISSNSEWTVDKYDGYISVVNSHFCDKNREFGLFFGIENIDWNCLCAEDHEDGLQIYLYYVLPDKNPKNMKQFKKEWEAKVLDLTKKNKPILIEKYHVLPEPNYLVKFYLNDVLNILKLGEDPQYAINKTLDLFMDFVRDTKDLLVDF